MKKFFLSFALALLLLGSASVASAFHWNVANQVTIAWTAVTTLENGDPIPTGDFIEYSVFKSKLADKSDMTLVGTTAVLEQSVTFTEEGSYFLGVSAIRKIDGEEVSRSAIAWSDNPAYCQDGNDFGVKFYLIPALPNELFLK